MKAGQKPQRSQYLLCVDVGTSSLKSACIDIDGRVESLSRERILFEQSSLYDWSATTWVDALRTLVSRIPQREQIIGIVLSGNGPTLVALDERDRQLGPVLMWMDGREDRLEGQASFYLPKIAWFRRSHPELFERAARFVSCPEYLAYVLCGVAATVLPSDDFAPSIWTKDGLDAYGLDPALVPPMVGPGTVIGGLRSAFAADSGLPAGIPVMGGGADFLMSLLGTATTVPGRTCDRAGTSEGINSCADRPVHDSRVRSLPHIIPGLYNIAGILSSTGRLFEWFREISGQAQEPYDRMLDEISHASDGPRAGDGPRASDGTEGPWFFPTLHAGPSWEFSNGMFIGLGALHGRREMGRAVVNSIAYAVREAVDNLERNGLAVDSLRVCGGQAKNAIWNQMKADMCGKPLLVPQTEDAELVGNAAAGFAGLGNFSGLADAAEHLVRFKAEYHPDPERYERYTDSYLRYQEVYLRFRTAFREISSQPL